MALTSIFKLKIGKIKKIALAIQIICCIRLNAQDMPTRVFQSEVMIDQSLSGITKKIVNSCVINFIDPKNSSLKILSPDERPIGQLLIHNIDRDIDVSFEIKYVNSTKENNFTKDLYAVVTSTGGGGIHAIIISNEVVKTPEKIYTHQIMLCGYKNGVYTKPAYYSLFFATKFNGIDDIINKKKK